jgi:protein-L-isoaspartate(D-aspartate) O-methyltransferase
VQKLVAFERAGNFLVSVALEDCGFISLRGAFAGPERYVQLGQESGLYLLVEDRSSVDAEAAYQLLRGPHRDLPTSVRVTLREIWGGLSLWLALREPNFCSLGAQGAVVQSGIVPNLFDFSSESSSTVGLFGEHSLCMLISSVDQPFRSPECITSDPLAFELFVRNFGPDDTLARRLIEQVIAWDAAGRPSNEGLRIHVYPLDTDYVSSENVSVVTKRWTRLVLNWQ